MGWLKSAVGWARDAWHGITSPAASLASALTKMWHWVASIHGLLGWLLGIPVLDWMGSALGALAEHTLAWEMLDHLLARIPAWIRHHLIMPWVRLLLARIARLQHWTAAQLHDLRMLMMWLYLAARLYARQLTAAEHRRMMYTVAEEHHKMLLGLRATLAEVQKQAASGYNSGTPDRKSVITRLLEDLAAGNPAVRHLVSDLVGLVIDIDTVDNPLARWAIQKLLAQVIDRLGIDKAVGDLAARLLQPLIGKPRASGLYDVTRDTALRLTALEAQWADFMAAGGPDVEQAGREWKALRSLAVDASLLAFLGLAVTDPAAWAASIADTAGPPADRAMTAVADTVGRI